MQLALVGGIAAFAAVIARGAPAWQRLYCLGLGALFLFFAVDEYYALHERLPNWTGSYAALGAVTLVCTAALAWRASPMLRRCLACLLLGLAVAAGGATVFNMPTKSCAVIAPLSLRYCLDYLFLGETFELLGAWLAIVAALGILFALTPAASRRWQGFIYVLPLLWAGLILQQPLRYNLELRFFAQPADITFAADTQIDGYRLERRGRALSLHLYANSAQRSYPGLGYSLQVLDLAQQLPIAALDVHAGHQLRLKLHADYPHRYRQTLRLELPPETPANHGLQLTLTLWREVDGAYPPQPILRSDKPLLSETQVLLGEFVLPAKSAAAPAPEPLARFDNGFMLQMPPLPASAQAGRDLALEFSWGSAAAGEEDHAQFLHFGHEASGAWWVFDAPPLGARLPTRLWYSGLSESETWQVPLPAELAPGRYQVFTGLYRMRDKERVPAADAQGQPFLDARVPLGSLLIHEKAQHNSENP